MKTYSVTWRVEVQAKTPAEAAEQARARQAPGTTDTVFDTEADDGHTTVLKLPRVAPLLAVIMEGGVCQAIVTDALGALAHVDAYVIDYDALDPNDAVTIPQGDGGTARAIVGGLLIDAADFSLDEVVRIATEAEAKREKAEETAANAGGKPVTPGDDALCMCGERPGCGKDRAPVPPVSTAAWDKNAWRRHAGCPYADWS